MVTISDVMGLALAVAFVVLNGMFVAAEFALVKLGATRSQRAKKPTRPADLRVEAALDRLDRYLSVTQIGITLASLGLGWIGEPVLADLGERIVQEVTGQPLGPAGRGIIFASAFGLLTFAHVLFGELVPKLLGMQKSRETAVITTPLLNVVNVVLYPLLWLMDTASYAVLRAVGLSPEEHGQTTMSEDEILGIIAANVARGPHGEEKRELVRRVMRFSQRTARSAMVPRMDVVALPIDSSGAKAIEFIRNQQFSRILLLEGESLDEPVGYLYVKDLLFDPKAAELETMRSLKRDMLFVPESAHLDDVLRDMQRAQCPFAVVVDEYGGTSGIVTMEDLLEEIVGDIRDELDDEGVRIERRTDGWELDGDVTLDELASVAGISSIEGEQGVSIGAAVVSKLGRLPRIGDEVSFGAFRAEVVSVARRRVTRVRVRIEQVA